MGDAMNYNIALKYGRDQKREKLTATLHKPFAGRDFTLLELLVVITIIVILLSIMLPSLSKVRNNVKKIDCMNNLKQTALCVESYIAEYNGYILPCWTKTPTVAWGWIIKDLGYIQNETILQCKSSPEKILKNAAYALTNYAYNNRAGLTYSTDPQHALMKIIQIKMPSKDGLIIDGLCETYPEFYPNSDGSISWLDYRHSAGANVLFLDGHASWHKQLDPYFTAQDPNYCGLWAKLKY